MADGAARSLARVVQNAPFETLRLCLLAVAFRRCLELFQQRAEKPAASPTGHIAAVS